MVFGEVAFSRSRFVFWGTAPFLLAGAIAIPLSVTEWTPERAVLAPALSLMCVLAMFALRDARRHAWAARSLTGLVFLAYAAYVVDQVFRSGRPIAPTRRSESSPWNSILGMVVIGVPALWYTVLGRFTLRAPAPEPEPAPGEGDATADGEHDEESADEFEDEPARR